MTSSHPAWIEIDLDALVHNAGVLRRAIPTRTRLGILVKANGYGHGLEMAARAAVRGGADQLIVAAVNEGLALRAAGVEAPVLVGYPAPPEAVVEAVRARLELSVGGPDSTRRTLDAWPAGAAGQGELVLHVEVDTGMGRGGALPGDVPDVVASIERTAGTRIGSIWSHLSDGRDAEVSRRQTHSFDAAVAAVPVDVPRHLIASEGLFAASAPPCDMVRIGLAFYGELGVGFVPAPERASLARELRPALTVKARPVRIQPMPAGANVGYGSEWIAQRDSVVATLPIGYADGWSRAYWPGASALVRGVRVQLIGRVSMDSVCADVTDVASGAARGITFDDEFVLLGAQGTDRITANELAELRCTNANEVLTSFGGRLQRVYTGDL